MLLKGAVMSESMIDKSHLKQAIFVFSSLQWRLMRRNVIRKRQERDKHPRSSLICMLVPVPYGEYGNGLINQF